MGFHEVPECSITFHMLLSPSIGFYAMFSEFGPSLSYLILSYLILSYLIFLIFCLPAGFWCWDDFKYPRGYPHVQQQQQTDTPNASLMVTTTVSIGLRVGQPAEVDTFPTLHYSTTLHTHPTKELYKNKRYYLENVPTPKGHVLQQGTNYPKHLTRRGKEHS